MIESRSIVASGAGEKGSNRTAGPLGVMDIFLTLIEVMVSWVCIYVKMYQIMLFKYLHFIVCTLIKLLKVNFKCARYLNTKYKMKEETLK